MAEVSLTQGQIAFVDDADLELVNQYKWYAHRHRNTFYAATNIVSDEGYKVLKMHRLLLPNAVTIDHADRNGLNNSRSNLRVCTDKENRANRPRQTNNRSSQYKGVSWHKVSSRWRAQVNIKGKRKHVGYFSTEREAAEAYDKAALESFGKFAYCNFSQDAVM